MKIAITGSEGLLGKEISNFLESNHQIHRLDLSLGHDLTDESFVKKWFKTNHADGLINCFALNDHVDKIVNNEELSKKFDNGKYLAGNVKQELSLSKEISEEK